MKEIEFEGTLSGDYECFCWDVTKKIFKQITGRNPDKWDKSTFNKGLYKLYPAHILEILGIGSKDKCKIKISGETTEKNELGRPTNFEELINRLEND